MPESTVDNSQAATFAESQVDANEVVEDMQAVSEFAESNFNHSAIAIIIIIIINFTIAF